MPTEATSIERDDGHYRVRLQDGDQARPALLVVPATGGQVPQIYVPRADYSEQMSIYYAASQAEALLRAGDAVAIVGGGNSAGQAAVFPSGHAARVTLIVREPDLSEHMSRYLMDRVYADRERAGHDRRRGCRNCTARRRWRPSPSPTGRSGTRCTVKARALFAFIGMTPCTGLVRRPRRGR